MNVSIMKTINDKSLKTHLKHINFFCGWKALRELPGLYFGAEVDDVYHLKMVSVTALSWKPQIFPFIVLHSSFFGNNLDHSCILFQNLRCSVQNLTRNMPMHESVPLVRNTYAETKVVRKRSNTNARQSKEYMLVWITVMQSWKATTALENQVALAQYGSKRMMSPYCLGEQPKKKQHQFIANAASVGHWKSLLLFFSVFIPLTSCTLDLCQKRNKTKWNSNTRQHLTCSVIKPQVLGSNLLHICWK